MAWNTAIAAIPAVVVLMFAGWKRWNAAVEMFAYSFAYANVIGLMAATVMPWIGPRIYGFRTVYRWASLVGVLAVLAGIGAFLGTAALWAAGFIPSQNFLYALGNSSKMSLLLTEAFGIGSFLFFSMQARLQQTTLDLRTRELETERAGKLVREARLASLESRIHPHFLFNALNSVSALIREDPERAERQIERISRFLRFSLDRATSGVVPLEEELRTVGDYLEIERTRFGDRLRYSISVAPETKDIPVPPLAVQVLVENSLKYAVAPRREGGEVRVTARRDRDRLIVDVWDDGPGFSPELRPSGHGLDLLEGRLAAQFGEGAKLHFTNGNGMKVAMEIPCVRS